MIKEKEKKPVTYRNALIVFTILTLILFGTTIYYNYKYEMMSLGCVKLTSFLIEEQSFCLGKLNQSIENFSADFLRYKTDEMIKQRFNDTSK